MRTSHKALLHNAFTERLSDAQIGVHDEPNSAVFQMLSDAFRCSKKSSLTVINFIETLSKEKRKFLSVLFKNSRKDRR